MAKNHAEGCCFFQNQSMKNSTINGKNIYFPIKINLLQKTG